MDKKRSRIITGALGICLVAALIFGLNRSMAADRMSKRLEAGYTQRLMESQEHLQALSLKLGKSPLAADARLQVELLTGISRQAEGVVSGLSALPLSHTAMGDTIKFCNQLSDYALQQALLVASGRPLEGDTLDRLITLRDQCTLLAGQLAVAQESMLHNSLRLWQQDSVFYAPARLSDRPLEAVGDQDHGMDYPAMVYDGAFSDATHFGAPKALGEGEITAEEALTIARDFVGADRVAEAEGAGETAGLLAGYSITLTLQDGAVLNAEVTRQGGKMLWLMPEHASFQQRLTVEDCTANAAAFLQSRGYGEMEHNHIRVYDGLCVINFVAVQDGVLLYPDLVKIQLRMDTGEVVGLEANNYLMNHTRREKLAPSLSRQQALERVSPRLNATGARLCLIPHLGEERLCYEVPGMFEENEYRIYVDALTGEEVEILMMIEDAEGQLSA